MKMKLSSRELLAEDARYWHHWSEHIGVHDEGCTYCEAVHDRGDCEPEDCLWHRQEFQRR